LGKRYAEGVLCGEGVECGGAHDFDEVLIAPVDCAHGEVLIDGLCPLQLDLRLCHNLEQEDVVIVALADPLNRQRLGVQLENLLHIAPQRIHHAAGDYAVTRRWAVNWL